jgi:hypothetical protein
VDARVGAEQTVLESNSAAWGRSHDTGGKGPAVMPAQAIEATSATSGQAASYRRERANRSSRSCRRTRTTKTVTSDHARMCAVSHDEQALWTQEFERDGGVVFPSSRAKMPLGLLGCIAFSAVGIWMLLQGDAVSAVIGSLSIAFFGFVGVPDHVVAFGHSQARGSRRPRRSELGPTACPLG